MSALPKPVTDRYAPMTEADLAEVVAIEREIYPFPWTRGNFLDSVRAGYSVWVLRRGAVLVAYSVMTLMIDEAHLLNLSVARDRQRAGFGWRTLEWMAEVARGYGARTMLLESDPAMNRPSGCISATVSRRSECGVGITRRRPGARTRW